ncbi:MAG: exodeoxyribonuclease III [Deltaproteobacteria bacterium]|nr:exodeoxyribonuclease III [Deltaproteobacteria bacterium]
MRLATWNVNSVRSRLDALVPWLAATRPDVVVLQELKVQQGEFPFAEIAMTGYQVALVGQKTYNGVAVLARQPIAVRATSLDDGADDPQARLIDCEVAGLRVVSVYVPNGGEPGSDKYAYKLQWLRRLRAWLDRTCAPCEALAIGGDWNIAPDDLDVRYPAAWKDTVLCTPEVRRAWRGLCQWGLCDAARAVHPEARMFSWWDYRAAGLERNDGLRIDHWLVTAPLRDRLVAAGVDQDLRHGDKPSDHAPVWIELAGGG